MSPPSSPAVEHPAGPSIVPSNITVAVPVGGLPVLVDDEEERRRLIAEHKAKVRAMRAARAADTPPGAAPAQPIDDVDTNPFPVVLTASSPEEIIVPKQLRYKSDRLIRIITDEDADRPCVELGLQGTLDILNRIFRTSYTIDTPHVRPHLQRAVDEAFDIGFAYAYFRCRWYNISELGRALEYVRKIDQQLRLSVLRDDRIVNPLIPPRRVWDLWSNRVVPYWVMDSHLAPQQLWSVSHSWMPLDKRHDVLTNINGRKWPVPMPTDVTLERVRIELLNFGAEYMWLDVLCLRQYGGVEEHLRAEEWKLDVPTIGRVYHADRNQNVVCYFSGLGRPFTVEKGFMSEPRHWFNRAWTLQETNATRITGGITENSPVDTGEYGDSDADRFYAFLSRLVGLLAERPTNIFPILASMQKRDSVNPVDKVAGLAYILQSTSVPIYKENENVEDAWTRLVENMHEKYRGDMFFLYPTRGDSGYEWRPSWRQITQMELPAVSGVEVSEPIVYDFIEDVPLPEDYGHVYRYNGNTLSNCLVRGLSKLPAGKQVREGEIVLERTDGTYTFKVFAPHDELIPEERFTLVGGGYEYWAVGTADAVYDNATVLAFHKISVLRLFEEDRDRFMPLRWKLCIRRDVFLY